MSNIDTADIEELISRYNFLIEKYIPLTLEIAEKLERFGKYKQELQIISAEFVKRGYNPENKNSFESMIQEEIKKRNIE